MGAAREPPRPQARNQRITAGLVGIAAAVAVVAIGWIVETSARPDATAPATQPTKAPAVEVAWQFLHQLAAFNQDQAVSYLAEDADLSGMGLKGPREFRSILSWQQATGFKWIPTSCEETHRTLADGTWVTCDFDFHALRSDQIGKGPYSSSYINLAVKDGEIVRMSAYLERREFWHQMWLPFGAWVTSNYPEDVAAMYKPSNLQPPQQLQAHAGIDPALGAAHSPVREGGAAGDRIATSMQRGWNASDTQRFVDGGRGSRNASRSPDCEILPRVQEALRERFRR